MSEIKVLKIPKIWLWGGAMEAGSAKWYLVMLAVGLLVLAHWTSSASSHHHRHHHQLVRITSGDLLQPRIHPIPLKKLENTKLKNGGSVLWSDERFKRYSWYVGYTSKQQPMAYVRIQPVISPPTKRKCVRCMVVYKPCPPPPRIVLPPNKYKEPAKKWKGLMYGEFKFFLGKNLKFN